MGATRGEENEQSHKKQTRGCLFFSLWVFLKTCLNSTSCRAQTANCINKAPPPQPRLSSPPSGARPGAFEDSQGPARPEPQEHAGRREPDPAPFRRLLSSWGDHLSTPCVQRKQRLGSLAEGPHGKYLVTNAVKCPGCGCVWLSQKTFLGLLFRSPN